MEYTPAYATCCNVCRYRKVGYKDYMQREDEQSYFSDQLLYMRALAPILKDWLGTAQVFQGGH
jgi:hypothetical protein